MRALILLALLAGCAQQGAYPYPDCKSFKSQDEAQLFYEKHIEHWWTLDPKGTGNACMGLKAA